MVDIIFLTLAEVIEIHVDQIRRYGGSHDIRDMNLLSSAIAMPSASFGGDYLHSDIYEMAAAYASHIAQNHPFIDGNKRVALASTEDYYIIAVSGGRIYRIGLLDGPLSFIISSVLPFGDLVLHLDTKTRKVTDTSFQYKDSIIKNNNHSISTTYFEDSKYSGITGILYSASNALWHPEHIGVEVHFVHNPIATNKISQGTFRFGHEWWADNEVLNGRKYG